MVAIFDTCFASNLYKNTQQEGCRSYELLTASGHDKTTARPGPRSFTTALISSLKALLDEYGDTPFTIRQLCEKINLHPQRRKNPSHVWSMFKRYDRNIELAPLKRDLTERQKHFNLDQTRAVLSLRLPLTVERLNQQEINNMARAFSNAAKKAKIPVKRIDWWRLQSVGRITRFRDLGVAINFARQWKRRTWPPIASRDQTMQTMHDPQAQTAHDLDATTTQLFRPVSEATPPSQIIRKRKHSCDHDIASSSRSKRRSLGEVEQHEKPKTDLNPLTPQSATEPDTT